MGRISSKLKNFYKSSLLSFVAAILILSPIAPLAKVLADAPDPVIPFGGVVTTDGSGHPVFTLNGNWQWTTHFDNKGDGSKDCNQDRYAAGYAIDWHDATQPGNLVQNGSIIAHVGTPTDNNVHYIHLGGDPDPTGDPTGATRCGVYAQHGVDSHGHPIFYNTGNWGPISHTYPIGTTTFSACVVTYDVHNTNTSELTAGGAGHNGDNSVEKNGSTPLGNGCFSATVPPTLNLTKSVTNDNGGSKTPHDWDLTASGTDGFTDKGDSTTFHQVDAGVAYNLSESSVAGYAATGDFLCNGGVQSGNTITLSAGQNVTCTIANDDIAPSLTLDKIVSNNHGGTAHESDWTLHADGASQSPTNLSGPGAAGSTDVVSGSNFKADTYTLSETGGPSGYSASNWTCTNNVTVTNSQITLANGQATVCSITNSDIAPHLTVNKMVLNPYCNPANCTKADANSFPLFVDGSSVTNGQKNQFNAGNHTISETQQTGYSFTGVSGDCTFQNQMISISLGLADDKSCTLTNTAIQPKLIVIKHVINDNSGNKSADDFTMTVTGNSQSVTPFPGDENGTMVGLNEGSYNVDEQSHVGYTESFSGDCDSTISIGQTKTCTITNNDNPNPAIQVVKNGPATAHEGDTITYTFDVTNIGDTQTLSDITVSDNVAGIGNFVSGDTNNNGLLDKGETWVYTKQYAIPADTNVVNNTVTACADNHQVCDTDYHHLMVLHPDIHVEKFGPSTAFAGDTVTYTFDVTNPGDTPLSITKVNDNVAGDGVYQSGDTHNIGFLDTDETWVYTKQFTIPSNQTSDIHNTVTACGHDSLQLQVCDTADHNLIVLNPGIHVVKSGPSSAAAGSTVTYTFTVTNTGNVPLSALTVNDNIAGAGTYQSGDTNSNDKLDLTETWIYTAQYTIPANQFASVNNTVTACGSTQPQEVILELDTQQTDNNNTVCAEASHTLVIPKVLAEATPPQLVNTGQSAITKILAGAAVLTMVGAVNFVATRKR